MNCWISWAFALGVFVVTAGCVPMPKTPSVAADAGRMLRMDVPFAIQVDGEPIDVGDPITALTIEQAQRSAIAHDPRIQAALARVRQAETDAQQVRLLPNPVIGISFRIPEAGGTSIIDADLSAELLSFLTRPGRISAADSRLRKASSDALVTVLDVVADVQRRYAETQSLHDRIGIEESRRTTLQQLVSVAESRLKAGEAAKLDVLTAQGTLAALDIDLMTLRAQDRAARLTLARLIGQPSRNPDWSFAVFASPPVPQLSESEWITIALKNRPEISVARWELAALGQEVRLAKLEPWSGGAGVAAERDGGWSIGPSASVALPIFDNGEVARAKRQAMVTEQKHELTRVTRQIVEDVRIALDQLRSVDESLERVRSIVIPLQEQKLKQAQDGYRAGIADVLTIRLAEQDLQDARSRLIELQSQQLRTRFDLDRAVGGPGAYTPAVGTPTTLRTESN